MTSMSYYNGKGAATASLFGGEKSGTFRRTLLPTAMSFPSYQFVSCSVADDNTSGSLIFTANTASLDSDYVKRYKFFGNKVCNVLGIPENYWIYADKFRLPTSGSESNYLSGDVLAQSVHIKDNFAISNAGSIESDLPFHHSKDTDRWIKWTDFSGSIPTNDMMLGYSNLNDRYELRMQNRDLLISSSTQIEIIYPHDFHKYILILIKLMWIFELEVF